jgi:hypothetical protein
VTPPNAEYPMAIKQWHVGKVVLLWAWSIAVCFVLSQIIAGTASFVPGFILISAILAILVTLSVVTWKWFGGKEQ